MAFSSFFFFKDTATPEIYPLSLHAALPISLTVINAAAGEIAADGYAQHRGTFEAAIGAPAQDAQLVANLHQDRKSTRLNSSHANISYAVFCLKKKKARS